jgi:transcriptional regulator with XRE-family HTH domain
MHVGDRVAFFRKRAGLKHAELAKLLGVDRSAVGHWESHRSEPSRENWQAICEVLGVDVGEFWGDLPEPATADDSNAVPDTAA